MPEGEEPSNREKKVASRAKRRRYKQGTRSYLHAMTNSVTRRLREAGERADDPGKK
jgi:hypothetical protein